MRPIHRSTKLLSLGLLVVLVLAGGVWLAKTPSRKPVRSIVLPALLPPPTGSNILAYVSQIEFLPLKRGEPLDDPHAAAIVAMGYEAGPLLLDVLTNDAPSKYSYLFEYKLGDVANALLEGIYSRAVTDSLVARNPPLDTNYGKHYYIDYAALSESPEGRKEIQKAWRQIVDSQPR